MTISKIKKYTAFKKLVGFTVIMLASQGCVNKAQVEDTVQAKHPMNSVKTVSRMPEFSWDTMPLYMHVWKRSAFTEAELNYLAQYPLITLEKAQGSKEGTVQARYYKSCSRN